jgi:hypothetical protein
LLRLTFFGGHIFIALEIDLLLSLPINEFKSFSEFSDGHLHHEAMATSFCRVETLGTLNRDLLNLPDLPYELFPLPELMGFLVLSSLKSLIDLSFDCVTNFLIVLVHNGHFVAGIILLSVNLSDYCLLLVQQILLVVSSFIKAFLRFNLHPQN